MAGGSTGSPCGQRGAGWPVSARNREPSPGRGRAARARRWPGVRLRPGARRGPGGSELGRAAGAPWPGTWEPSAARAHAAQVCAGSRAPRSRCSAGITAAVVESIEPERAGVPLALLGGRSWAVCPGAARWASPGPWSSSPRCSTWPRLRGRRCPCALPLAQGIVGITAALLGGRFPVPRLPGSVTAGSPRPWRCSRWPELPGLAQVVEASSWASSITAPWRSACSPRCSTRSAGIGPERAGVPLALLGGRSWAVCPGAARRASPGPCPSRRWPALPGLAQVLDVAQGDRGHRAAGASRSSSGARPAVHSERSMMTAAVVALLDDGQGLGLWAARSMMGSARPGKASLGCVERRLVR
jgi:hypothetical protein